HADERGVLLAEEDGLRHAGGGEPRARRRVGREDEAARGAARGARLRDRERPAHVAEAEGRPGVGPADDATGSHALASAPRAGVSAIAIRRPLSADSRTAHATASVARPSAPSSAGRRPEARQSTNSASSATYISFTTNGTVSSVHAASPARRSRIAVPSKASVPSLPTTSR